MLTYPGYESLNFSVFDKAEVVVVVEPALPPPTEDEAEKQRKQTKWEQIIDTVKKTAEKIPGEVCLLFLVSGWLKSFLTRWIAVMEG